jgi:transporter family-2 protein
MSQLFIAPKLGAAPFLGTLVTVGVLASIALDHYGSRHRTRPTTGPVPPARGSASSTGR